MKYFIPILLAVNVLGCIGAEKNDSPKPRQTVSHGEPPTSPTEFDPDPRTSPVLARLIEEFEFQLRRRLTISWGAPLQSPPPQFNPDPGAMIASPKPMPILFYREDWTPQLRLGGEEFVAELKLPRSDVWLTELYWAEIGSAADEYGREALPFELQLPRRETRLNEWIRKKWERPQYVKKSADGTSALPYPANTEPRHDRWRIGFAPWRRYTSGDTETPYEAPVQSLWHPYRQSVLKGDAPILGDDIFLSLTAASDTIFEARRLPTPSGVSANLPDSAEFFGQSEQVLVSQFFSATVDLFRGETVFRPPDWTIRLQPVYNINYTDTEENNAINPNPQRGTDRRDYYFALQQWFVEKHLFDLSDNYDFIALRVGNQIFNSDFRGFVFNETNLGARVFGNADNNRWQYNLALFDMREKDTNSELNTFDQRDQRVLIANLFRQDLFVSGYNAQLSFHANFDEGETHYDKNGNIARPAPLGTVAEHDVRAYYFGWTGEGHIGRWNVSHAFYQVFGRDELNGLAGREVDINAQMAGLEMSYDRDWIRYKGTFFYASGDDDAEDGTARGFDTIVDNPNFTGGPFSYWSRQGFGLAGTSVALKQRNSLVPNLRTSKTEGQSNFVNPGVFIFGVGAEVEVTPKLRGFLNANYLRFAETDPIETALFVSKIRGEIGWDLSLGVQYRPLLTDNIVISAGVGALIPGEGFRDIYRTSTDPVPGFGGGNDAGMTDDFLYSALIAITLTY